MATLTTTSRRILQHWARAGSRASLDDGSPPPSANPARLIPPVPGGGSYPSPFPSAIHTNTRTSTAFFPLDARRELRPQARLELVKKQRFLRNSTGVFRALCEKPVQFALPGGLTPSSATGDPDFDAAADRYFDRWATKPVSVDREYTFYESQEMIGAEVPCDGDFFVLKVRSGTARCQVQFLKTHQVGNGPLTPGHGPNSWQDGVFRNAVHAALFYRVLQDPLGLGIASHRDYSCEDMLHIRDPLRCHIGRGLPWGYHGSNSGLDILDMGSLDKVAAKLNLALAAVIKKTGARPGGLGHPINVESIFDTPAAGSGAGSSSGTDPETPPPSGQPNGRISWEALLGGGAMPVLEDGQDIQFLDLKRVSGQFIPSAEYLIRDIAIGWGLSFEAIWNMAALGGATARFILEDLNAFLSKLQRMLISRYCHPTRSWVIANGIVRGEIPECKSEAWWECTWQGPQKVTVDRGRDGNLYVKLLSNGMLTLDEWWSMLGKDARKMRRKRIDEIAEDMAYCKTKGIPYAAYMAPAPGTAPVGTPDTPSGPSVDQPGSFSVDPALDLEIRQVLSEGLSGDNIPVLERLIERVRRES
ncbi:MAG: phage portal protein [Chthoniobacteraceae bacterium]